MMYGLEHFIVIGSSKWDSPQGSRLSELRWLGGVAYWLWAQALSLHCPGGTPTLLLVTMYVGHLLREDGIETLFLIFLAKHKRKPWTLNIK